MNEMHITLTDDAREALVKLASEQNQDAAFLRIWVQGGGCSGLQYGMALDDEKSDDDITIESNNFTIVVDCNSAKYLQNSTIEYNTDLLGGGFKVNNPNAKRSCGCGTSFQPEEEHPSSEREKSCNGCRQNR